MSPNCFLVHTALDGRRRRRRPLHNVRPSRYNVTVAVPRTILYSGIFALEKLLEVSGGSAHFKQASEFKCALKSFHMILVQKYMPILYYSSTFPRGTRQQPCKSKQGHQGRSAGAANLWGLHKHALPPPPCQQSSHGLPLL